MAKMGGCNAYIAGPNGTHSTRMQPQNLGRKNMSKGGVNDHSGGSDAWGVKPKVKAGGASQGKNHLMHKGY